MQPKTRAHSKQPIHNRRIHVTINGHQRWPDDKPWPSMARVRALAPPRRFAKREFLQYFGLFWWDQVFSSDLGTAPYPDSSHVFDVNFSLTNDLRLGSVLNFDPFRCPLTFLLPVPLAISIPLPVKDAICTKLGQLLLSQ
ncbi:hypothetical protein EVAR_87235_1 [Eumeta japonica]|uniref:Uncharacterized protein n=1 Tax=Eumeta variegata TaxID=151549 RepID=A0A4C1YL41_EUMVA|nr:hypothetical protein EVAR_87235_1 [Eumeta japonica]